MGTAETAITTGTSAIKINAAAIGNSPVSYTHLRAHETVLDLVCRLLLEKKKGGTTQAMADLWADTYA